MKKLRLNNIFHWLYALLMFLPFIMLTFNVLIMFGRYDPLSSEISLDTADYINQILFVSIPYTLFSGGSLSSVHQAILNVFGFFTGLDFDGTVIENSVVMLFVYWVEVSLEYLCFDVLMFLINLAHRWLDRGSEL